MNDSYPLVATAAFGLEAVVVRELKALGYQPTVTRPGRIEFTGDDLAVARTNLWLRSADRVLLQLARFVAVDFDTLFEATHKLPWENWINQAAAIPVRGRSHKSQLSSVPACQRTVKKAIVERLQAKNGPSSLPETGPPVAVEVALLDDEAILSIDTTGDGLHRRGYRKLTGSAQIRETLAAALVQLSFWRAGRPLIDPFCGSGTIVIEAAMLGRNLAPGRKRSFAAEHWPPFPAVLWEQARQEADDLAGPPLETRLLGTDVDKEILSLARYHAEQAGVENDIHFQQQAFAQLRSSRTFGCLVTNPPYGIRMGEKSELEELYTSMPVVLRRLATWSHFILTAKSDLEQLFGQPADRRRKLFNGQIECTYYQFHGPRAGDASDKKIVFGGFQDHSSRQFEDFANRLKKRARHLRRWPDKRGISCYRLYDRDVADVPLVIDRYEEALHLSEYERPHTRTIAQHADWLDQLVRIAGETLEVAPENIFLKQRKRQRGSLQYQRVSDQGAVRVVQEGGLKFQINLSDYLDTGLFLDHRVTRQMVREAAAGKNFLNLFGYTGAFTVYAAAGGAARTTTVDLSSSYLEWARENLRLNGLEVGAAHRTCCQDVWAFFKNLSSQITFDLVVVDPPTFSNSKQLDRNWDVQRDHANLLQRVLAHTTPGGTIYFSTNSRRFKLDESALADTQFREISRQTVPEDFRNRRIHRCWRIVKGTV